MSSSTSEGLRLLGAEPEGASASVDVVAGAADAGAESSLAFHARPSARSNAIVTGSSRTLPSSSASSRRLGMRSRTNCSCAAAACRRAGLSTERMTGPRRSISEGVAVSAWKVELKKQVLPSLTIPRGRAQPDSFEVDPDAYGLVEACAALEVCPFPLAAALVVELCSLPVDMDGRGVARTDWAVGVDMAGGSEGELDAV